MIKHSYRLHEKSIYLPKNVPSIIELKPMNYLCIPFSGNPNSESFTACVGALYSLSYTIKMKAKSIENYYDYVVYPLEGHWDLIDTSLGSLDKDNYKALLMIRQPDFVNIDIVEQYSQIAFQKTKDTHILDIMFKSFDEGLCVQMLHIGSYDTEPETFKIMEQFTSDNLLTRTSLTHKEIYLSDPRKTQPDKLKTVLRYTVSKS